MSDAYTRADHDAVKARTHVEFTPRHRKRRPASAGYPQKKNANKRRGTTTLGYVQRRAALRDITNHI